MAAQDSFERVVEIEPGHLPAYRELVYLAGFLLAASEITEEDYLNEVQESLATVNRIDPESKEAYYITIQLLMFHGDTQGASDAFRKLSTIDDDPQRLIDAADAEYVLGNITRALELYSEYLEAEPLQHGSRASYALYLARAGRLAEAEDQFARATLLAPDNGMVLIAESSFYNYYYNEQAQGLQSRLVARDKFHIGDSGDVLTLRILLDLGDLVAAKTWLAADAGLNRYPIFRLEAEYFVARYEDDTDAALDLARQTGEAVVAMAGVGDYHSDFDWLRLLQRHDPDFALAIYRKRVPHLTTEEPKLFLDVAAAISLADLYLQTDKQALAHDLLDQSIESLSSNPEHYNRPATTMIYALKGDVPMALQELRASIDANWRWEWWLLEKDPAYEILWDEPEFKAMMSELRADMDRQRAELHAMVDAGEIDLTPSRNSD
jgi:tetratricopeptide (TPR) repeat protein